ncbi:MAG TPA: pyrroline-5-carboxylate reductase [Epulopiscium sp.]|nr:pyrroline-5-carboxylate reductase [Candidatus Epulonipiscium sp.]
MTLVGFIGVGNMGTAMIQGIANRAQDVSLYAYDVDPSKIDALENSKINRVGSIQEICEKSKYIILAVKPQYYPEVFKGVNNYLTKEHIIITIAPGYSIAKVKKYLGNVIKVVRAMPNTPALVGEGMTAYCFVDDEMTSSEHDVIQALFSAFGKSVRIEEGNMEAIIATSGSSPAYAYLFIEAMADAAVSFGIGREDAYMLAAQSLKGAAQMVLETKKHPAQLKDDVCSPGGTTIQAVLKLEETQFRNSIIKAMTANYDKAMSMN